MARPLDCRFKGICAGAVGSGDCVDFARLRDHEGYLEETVLNAIRLFGEEVHQRPSNRRPWLRAALTVVVDLGCTPML